MSTSDPNEALARLAGSEAPFLIGVRHHSPACAAAVPALLDAFKPERILIELPAELEPWLEWLGHPALEAPVALAAVRQDRPEALFFYPFADFSPELAAVRWGIAHGVAVEAIDLPYLDSAREHEPRETAEVAPVSGSDGQSASLLSSVLRVADAPDSESLWDRLVEARAPGSTAEAVRRAALLFGWALRVDALRKGGVPSRDLARERYMRRRLARAGIGGGAPVRVAAVVGSFHAASLLEQPSVEEAAEPRTRAESTSGFATSLVPYAFELFDSRSGYPAGIRDPMWQQRVWAAARDGAAIEDALRDCVVQIAREVRRLGHVAGVPDASETVRMAVDLACLRGLPAPGRRELLEAIESALGRGEPLGRGRILARALEHVLVGSRRGRLAPGTPRSGLVPYVSDLVRELRLPGPDSESKDAETLRLDPLRSRLDRQRHLALERLVACGVTYASRESAYAGAAPGGAQQAIEDRDTLTSRWRVHWGPSTSATLELAGLRGVTLPQAAEGALRAEERRLLNDEKLTAAARLALLRAAAECGLGNLATEGFRTLMGPFIAEAGLAELVVAHALVQRIERGHIPGLPREQEGDVPPFALPPELRATELVAAAVRAVEGLSGSTRVEDAHALLEIVELQERTLDDSRAFGTGRLAWAIEMLARDGSPFMQGAAGVTRVLMRRETGKELGDRFGSWIDSADANVLMARIRGTMALAGPLMEADTSLLAPILDRVDALTDADYLARLPSLRGGFDVLSTAARDRLLDVLGERLDDGSDPRRRPLEAATADPPELLAIWAIADRSAAAELAGAGLLLGASAPLVDPVTVTDDESPRSPVHLNTLSARDRWRLILGRETEKLPPRARRFATALEELYGRGRGEGSRGELHGGGGRDAPFPTVREWATELEALFGAEVREEVLGRAAEHGRAAAALEVDPETVTPSIELLERVLSLKGGLAEVHLARLRKLVARVVEALTAALANRIRPALTGLATARPTRRAVGPIDLRRTLSSNLRTARIQEDGIARITPERLVFKTRARRSLDWHIVLVVDVSGSMDASIIYSAMMAAILSALPAVTVHFVAFNTEVIDLSARVDDPLGLLLEVSVGGGTLIGKGLRYARGLLAVPSRSLVLLVTDFEEGGSVPEVLAEVRALVESGARALGLAALDDAGKPRYQRAVAELVVGAGMPVAALTPLELAHWIGEQIR